MLYQYPYFRRACCRRLKRCSQQSRAYKYHQCFFMQAFFQAVSALFLSIRRSTSKKVPASEKIFSRIWGRSRRARSHLFDASSVAAAAERLPAAGTGEIIALNHVHVPAHGSAPSPPASPTPSLPASAAVAGQQRGGYDALVEERGVLTPCRCGTAANGGKH